jgi:hypothetical protein
MDNEPVDDAYYSVLTKLKQKYGFQHNWLYCENCVY